MKLKILVACAVLLAAACDSRANIILTQETWSVAGEHGWTGTNDSRDAGAWASSIANSGNRLTITANGDTAVREDYIFTDSQGLAGNKNYLNFNASGSNVTSISLDFYTVSAGGNLTPNSASISVYFLANKEGSSWIWYYDIPILAGTTNYQANIGNYGSWYNTQGHWSYANFISDLADVDEVGILLSYWPNIAGQQYQIDNFTLNTLLPEPRDYAILGVALLSLLMIFRKRLPVFSRAKVE